MRVKILALVCGVILNLCLFSGCNSQDKSLVKDKENAENSIHNEVKSTSIVTNEEELRVAVKESYSITLKDDIKCESNIVMEGEFSKTDTTESNKVIEVGRELNLFYIDDNTNIINNYRLEAPNLIINSKDTTLKGGKFIGDIYVESNGFILDDTKVDGNIYFRNLEFKESFVIKNTSNISGEIGVKEK